MIKYILPFLISFSLTIFFILLLMPLAKRINWKGRAEERHIRGKNILRIGGIAMIMSFNLAIFFNKDLFVSPQLYGVMAASLLLLVVGTWDDVREIFWKTQFFFQIASAVLVFILGVRIYFVTNPFSGGVLDLGSGIGEVLAAFLVIFWILLITNAMNWLDGIDGLSGGITFIGAVTIFVLSLKPEVNQPPVAIISAILAGATGAFLVFNFNPSLILAGTSGSMFMGFALAVLAIFAGTKIATSILVLVIPIIDFVWVIGERIKNKKSIFKPDRNHLHYKLLELGWSQRKINFYYYGITILIAAVALNTRAIGKIITLILAVGIASAALLLINKKTKEYKKI